MIRANNETVREIIKSINIIWINTLGVDVTPWKVDVGLGENWRSSGYDFSTEVVNKSTLDLLLKDKTGIRAGARLIFNSFTKNSIELFWSDTERELLNKK